MAKRWTKKEVIELLDTIGYASGDAASESDRSDGVRLALRELGDIGGHNIPVS